MNQLPTLSSFYPFVEHGVRIAITLIAAYVVTKIAAKSIPSLRQHLMRVMTHGQPQADFELEKRSLTLAEIMRKAIVTVIWVVATLMAFREAGFDAGPI